MVRARWWRQRGFICFSNTEKGDGELRICGNACKKSAVRVSAGSSHEGRCTYFRSSKYFFQFGIFLFKRSRPRQMRGSLKKPIPTPAVVIFMNIADVVKRETARAGTRTAANLKRGDSCGNGGVGDSALHVALASSTGSLALVDLLSESLPSICNITDDVHDGSHFQPHCLLHGLFGLIMMRFCLTPLGGLFCCCCIRSYICRVRHR